VVGTILVYNTRATSDEQHAALVVNVAARQRALAERYTKDVLLNLFGYPADPGADASMLLVNADALLRGGTVDAVQGADGRIEIPRASSNWRVVAKLEQEHKLIEKLVATGSSLLGPGASGPDLARQILQLRIIGAQVGTITNDAVGEMTRDAEASGSRLVRVGIVLGVVGALSAIAMALLLRRASAQRAAQFRALVNKASDMITVVDPDLVVTYQSTSVERVFGHPVAEVVGKGLSDLMHPEDAESVVRALQDLAASPGSTGTVEYRLRHRDGSWRHVETAATNLISDHLVRGVVLNTRDVTRRVEAERTLQRLQAERAELLGRTVQAAEQERKRLSAELHDGPVQHLAALDLLLEGAGRRFEREGLSTARENVGQVQERLRHEVQGLRRMMRELRPPVLDNLGLEAALKQHLTELKRDTGLDYSIDSRLDGRLAPAQEIVLYRVAQEALTNVSKHASTNRAWVSLLAVNGDVVLEVRDEGAGFDPIQLPVPDPAGHFGLLGMRERIEMAGGQWELESGPGRGTVVRARLPREVTPA